MVGSSSRFDKEDDWASFVDVWQNSVDNNLQRNVSSCDCTSKFGQNDIELLLASISVNADNFVTVNNQHQRCHAVQGSTWQAMLLLEWNTRVHFGYRARFATARNRQ